MNRREFICAATVSLLAAPLAAEAQQAGKAARLGYVDRQSADFGKSSVQGLRQGLQELGYVDGRTIKIEYRFADGQPERLPQLIDNLLRLPVAVLVTPGTIVAQAAQRATATVPIVMSAGEPVESGLVTSLARPSGNVTGLSLGEGAQFKAKRLQLLKEAVPSAARVAYLANPSNPNTDRDRPDMQTVASSFGVQLLYVDARDRAEVDAALERVRRTQADGLITDGDPVTDGEFRRIAAFAAKQRLPAIYPRRQFVDAGA
jgi:putative tryptophan/tyrosine transport system substrate-binding protein